MLTQYILCLLYYMLYYILHQPWAKVSYLARRATSYSQMVTIRTNNNII